MVQKDFPQLIHNELTEIEKRHKINVCRRQFSEPFKKYLAIVMSKNFPFNLREQKNGKKKVIDSL